VDHSVKLRMNKASIGTPQAFSLFEFAHESARENLFRLDMWRSAEQAVSSKSEAHQGSEFVAMMSHEFRTPLNAILGFSGLLQHEVSTSLTDEQRAEYVTLIHGAAEHLLGLVNTILDVSKIGAGKYVVNCEPFDFGGAVKDATSMVSTLAQAKSVRLNVRAKTDDWRDVLADRRAIKQILINLLSNAVKYTPEHGCVTIDAWFEGTTLAFEVSDTGIGMSEADQKRVFSPFCQIDNGTTREVEGTGLGLALVDGLVALHGGDISLKSAVGVGTKVTVRLPNARAANADAANSNQTAINGGSDGEKRQSA
ncbi:MAG: HAMP domain-containing sensor histidine kinase, partial [Pseudomonadota bacterium]